VKNIKDLAKEDIDSCFSNLEDILNLHVIFLKLIQDKMSNWDTDNTTIGDLFLEKASERIYNDKFSLLNALQFDFNAYYKKYIRNYNASFASAHYVRKKSPEFDSLIQVCIQQ
jgi:hypothetical protein